MRRTLLSLSAVLAALALPLTGLSPARATGGTDLTDGEALYFLDNGGTTYVATDVPNAGFKATGTTPVDSGLGYDPTSMARDPSTGATYVLEWSGVGRRIERLDPSTGRRWASRQVAEPEGYDWLDSIAISPSGAMYGLGDQGGLYSITLGATTATVTKLGTTAITSSNQQFGLAFDPTGFLYGYDPATHTVRVLSLADGSTVTSYSTTGLPAGDLVVSMQIDHSSPNPRFWVVEWDHNDSLSALYAGTVSGSTIGFSVNGTGAMSLAGTSSAIYGWPILLAPAMHRTTLAHSQSATHTTRGRAVRLSTVAKDATAGTPLASVGVQLQRRSGTTWVLVKKLTTGATGAASLRLAPTRTTTYRWSLPARTTLSAYFLATTSSAFTVKVSR